MDGAFCIQKVNSLQKILVAVYWLYKLKKRSIDHLRAHQNNIIKLAGYYHCLYIYTSYYYICIYNSIRLPEVFLNVDCWIIRDRQAEAPNPAPLLDRHLSCSFQYPPHVLKSHMAC